MDKIKDLEKVESRSKKVRNIMMEKPPLSIRYGTIIIAVILFSAIFIALCYNCL